MRGGGDDRVADLLQRDDVELKRCASCDDGVEFVLRQAAADVESANAQRRRVHVWCEYRYSEISGEVAELVRPGVSLLGVEGSILTAPSIVCPLLSKSSAFSQPTARKAGWERSRVRSSYDTASTPH